MTNEESLDFFTMLDECCEMLGKPAKTQAGKRLFLTLLKGYNYKTLRGALVKHMQDPKKGAYVPAPADLIYQIEKFQENDGRPSADEAWSIVQNADDERQTVVMSDEIAEAWGIARNVFPDRVGARMAFRTAYERLVTESRNAQKPTHWFASYGHDPEYRDVAIKRAIELKRLPASALDLHKGIEYQKTLKIGSNNDKGIAKTDGVDVRQMIAELKSKLKKNGGGDGLEKKQ